MSNRHISMRNVCGRECEHAHGYTWLQNHNYLKSNTMSTSCQPINHIQRKHHHVGKLKGSFLLKSCKWTLSPLHEKGTLYREQMGWWLCDKPTWAARGREDFRGSCREHAPWLGFASSYVTSKSGTNWPDCFLPWLWEMWRVSHYKLGQTVKNSP